MINALKAFVVTFLLLFVSLGGMFLVIFVSWILGLIVWVIGSVFIWYIQRHHDKKQCPRCTEWIKRGATVCRYCGNTMLET